MDPYSEDSWIVKWIDRVMVTGMLLMGAIAIILPLILMILVVIDMIRNFLKG